MNRQIMAASPGAANRRTPLLPEKPAASRRGIGEVAGGTTAECAAVCCCCPCSVVNLLVLALYKVPAGIWRRVWARRRKRSASGRDGLLQKRPSGPEGRPRPTVEELEKELKRVKGEEKIDGGGGGDGALGTVDFLEEEMWDGFYTTGFWRSPTHRES